MAKIAVGKSYRLDPGLMEAVDRLVKANPGRYPHETAFVEAALKRLVGEEQRVANTGKSNAAGKED